MVRTEHTDPQKEQYDYLHEREWHFPHNIFLIDMKVYGIISGRFDSKTKGWESIFSAKMTYPEVAVSTEGDFGDEEGEDEKDVDKGKSDVADENPDF